MPRGTHDHDGSPEAGPRDTSGLDSGGGPREPVHLSPEERWSRGKAMRSSVPRSSHAQWAPTAERPDPVALLEQQAVSRVADLLPIRHGRMAASPFAYFRGAALGMASDLAQTPRLPLTVQLCGDAHLSNFGGFAAPDRTLVFDVNDFDETTYGPFDWDVKRLAASLEVASRVQGIDEVTRHDVTTHAARAYREGMRTFAGQGNLDVWYARLDVDFILARVGDSLGRSTLKKLRRNVAKAKTKDRLKAADRLTADVGGEPRFVADPPLLVPIGDLIGTALPERAPAAGSAAVEALVHRTVAETLRSYQQSLPWDLQRLLDSYRHVDTARKVVGVGSVGTRSWVAVFVGRDRSDPLFLQVKEAEESVLERFVGASPFETHGQRVVEGQKLMQAASDVLLGFVHVEVLDGVTRDFYVRQLWDWKASAEIEAMDPHELDVYGRICAWTLARAHARSGDRVAIAGYLGGGPTFDRAIAEFAVAYADQNERDHQRLIDAIDSGRVEATPGV